jgi:hypothetical protein
MPGYSAIGHYVGEEWSGGAHTRFTIQLTASQMAIIGFESRSDLGPVKGDFDPWSWGGDPLWWSPDWWPASPEFIPLNGASPPEWAFSHYDGFEEPPWDLEPGEAYDAWDVGFGYLTGEGEYQMAWVDWDGSPFPPADSPLLSVWAIVCERAFASKDDF